MPRKQTNFHLVTSCVFISNEKVFQIWFLSATVSIRVVIFVMYETSYTFISIEDLYILGSFFLLGKEVFAASFTRIDKCFLDIGN